MESNLSVNKLKEYSRIYKSTIRNIRMKECPICKFTVSKPCETINQSTKCIKLQLKAKQ